MRSELIISLLIYNVDMKNEVSINIELDENIKNYMEAVCLEMGLSMTEAFVIFAKKVAKEGRIPFELSDDDYLEDIIRDIREGRAHFSEHELIEVE
mgnify:FL=1